MAAGVSEEEDEDMARAIAMSMGQSIGASPPAAAPPGGGEERIVRRVIPADNSCLFNAVAYALEGGATDRAQQLRETVAALVLSDPVRWTEAELDGRPPDDYADWIQDDKHWGGGIELAVLSEHYGTEIAAFDCQSGRVDIFGQDRGYRQRAMLIYDGIHYDLLVKQLFDGAPATLDVTLFDVTDEDVVAKAKAVAEEAKKNRQFTDIAGFTLRCNVCQKGLVGMQQAQEHAKETGHANFVQY